MVKTTTLYDDLVRQINNARVGDIFNYIPIYTFAFTSAEKGGFTGDLTKDVIRDISITYDPQQRKIQVKVTR